MSKKLRALLRHHWFVVGNWTIYIDVPIPWTNRVVVLDVGAHPCLGWRYKT